LVLGVRVLGDVGVTVDGVRHEVAAPRQRAVLAMLALEANQPVGAACLIEGIWGDALPAHPEAALHVVVSRLRSSMGSAADRVVSGHGAYRLEVAESELDLSAAMHHLLRAQNWMQEQEPDRALEEVGVPLRAWSADPFGYLVSFPCYERASLRVRELWVALYALRIDALLASGRQVEALAIIDGWIADAPWDEHRRAQQMLALYLGGRQVDALRAYDDFRELLVDQLGIDPTAKLRDLHQSILHHDVSAMSRKVGLVSVVPPWTSLRLPFMGRKPEEERILERLRTVSAGGRAMVLVEGEPGIGKTRLVLEIARRVQDDAVVLAATGNDARFSAVSVIADRLVDVLLQLDDAELGLCLGRWPADLAVIAPRLRTRLPDLDAPMEGDPGLRAERIRRALVSCISALSRRAPILLVLDDLHRAGPELLLLLGYLLGADSEPRVAVLATARTNVPDRSSRLTHLSARLEQEGLLERVTLTGLDLATVTWLLQESGVPAYEKKAGTMHALTGGQPFFVGEMLDSSVMHANGDLGENLPRTVLDFVRYRAHALGAAEEQLLADASVFLTAFDAPSLAAIIGSNPSTTQQIIDRAVDAHILRPIGLRSFTFAHEVTRRALAETLSAERRADLNCRVAVAAEEAGEPAALIAAYWRQASGPDATAKTVEYARAAGEAAMARYDPAAAARWFEVACESAARPETQARLLIRRADALGLAGEDGAGVALRAALVIARELHDDDLLIECATAWAPTWSSGLPFDRPERVELLEAGAAVAKTDNDRALVLGRLATEMLYTPEGHRARPLADEALTLAEAGGDRRTRIEVRLRHFDATWSPHSLDARRVAIADTVRLASESEVVDLCFALSRSASAAIEAADLAAADTALAQLFDLGARHDLSVVTHAVTSVRAWRTALAGDLDTAGRLIKEAGEQATAAKLHNAAYGNAVQLLGLSWQCGRFGDLLPVLQLGTGDRDGTPFRIMLSRALVGVDRLGDARAVLDSITEAEFENLPTDPLWSLLLMAAAESAYKLGAVESARIVHRLLVPFSARVAFARSWVIGPIAFGAALTSAAVRGRNTDDLFEEAWAVAERLEAPAITARMSIGWATACLAREPSEIDSALLRARLEDARVICLEHRLEQLGQHATRLAVLVGK
jgi:DNA-binding SARP family transcriptional activator